MRTSDQRSSILLKPSSKPRDVFVGHISEKKEIRSWRIWLSFCDFCGGTISRPDHSAEEWRAPLLGRSQETQGKPETTQLKHRNTENSGKHKKRGCKWGTTRNTKDRNDEKSWEETKLLRQDKNRAVEKKRRVLIRRKGRKPGCAQRLWVSEGREEVCWGGGGGGGQDDDQRRHLRVQRQRPDRARRLRCGLQGPPQIGELRHSFPDISCVLCIFLSTEARICWFVFSTSNPLNPSLWTCTHSLSIAVQFNNSWLCFRRLIDYWLLPLA